MRRNPTELLKMCSPRAVRCSEPNSYPEAWRQWLLGGKRTLSAKEPRTHYEPRIPLTPTGLLMEGGNTQIPTPFD